MDRFGFIIHPFDATTYRSAAGSRESFDDIISRSGGEFVPTARLPYTLCSFERIRSKEGLAISGICAAVPLMPIEFDSLDREVVLGAVEQAASLLARKGARIVGLGGFTSVVVDDASALSKKAGVPLTSGNTLTAALALEGIYRGVYELDMSLLNATAAIVGATGDIGWACATALSRKVRKLNIAARNEKQLNALALELRRGAKASVEAFKYAKDAVHGADIVISSANAMSTVINPVHLKPGAIVCDVAFPANIGRELARARDDILVFDGGLAEIHHPEDAYNGHLGSSIHAKSVFGCLAETMALAFEGRFEPYSAGRGRITEERMAEIKAMARKHGIMLADFSCGDRRFTAADIKRIRDNALKARNECYYVDSR